jgi:hypothetical protein
MGPSIGTGVGVLLLAIPINTVLARKMKGYQVMQMGNKDARIKLMVSYCYFKNDIVYSVLILVMIE